MNNSQTPRPRFLRGAEEPEPQEKIPNLDAKSRAEWKVQNARLIAFGLWLSLFVWVWKVICEMRGGN